MKPGGALDIDCSHVGHGLGSSGYQFIDTCAGRSVAPNRRWALVQRAGDNATVTLTNAKGLILDEIPNLSDGMPFVIMWSPRSNWFFANHYLGSDLDRLQIFEIVSRTVIERSDIFADATRMMVKRYPCLARNAMVVASGWKWSKNGQRIAMIVYARSDACWIEESDGRGHHAGHWDDVWMIGDIRTGKIDPASVRIRANGTASFPTTGPYAEFK
jgi:hypothetical protein